MVDVQEQQVEFTVGNVEQNRQLGHGNINVNRGGHAMCQKITEGINLA